MKLLVLTLLSVFAISAKADNAPVPVNVCQDEGTIVNTYVDNEGNIGETYMPSEKDIKSAIDSALSSDAVKKIFADYTKEQCGDDQRALCGEIEGVDSNYVITEWGKGNGMGISIGETRRYVISWQNAGTGEYTTAAFFLNVHVYGKGAWWPPEDTTGIGSVTVESIQRVNVDKDGNENLQVVYKAPKSAKCTTSK